MKKYINAAKQALLAGRAMIKIARYSTDLAGLAEYARTLQELQSNNAKRCTSIDSVDAWLASLGIAPGNELKQDAISLDLGCGNNARNLFNTANICGVDIRESLEGDIKYANLATDPIPWPSDFFDYCTAFDFLEHVPRVLACDSGSSTYFPFVVLMSEIWRVLKPGGLFFHQTPAFPCKQAFQDPTHVNIITEDTMPYYFCEPDLYASKIGYGFEGKFECVAQAWLNSAWIVGVLKAVK